MKLKPLYLDGITFTPSMIKSQTQPLLAVRDCLIEASKLEHALALSMIHALLLYLAENTEEK